MALQIIAECDQGSCRTTYQSRNFSPYASFDLVVDGLRGAGWGGGEHREQLAQLDDEPDMSRMPLEECLNRDTLADIRNAGATDWELQAIEVIAASRRETP